MRYAILALGLFLVSCEKGNPPDQSTPGAPKAEAQGQPDGTVGAGSAPDEGSFFPLLPGSYWIYETFQEGVKQQGFREVDSVLSLTKTDTGFLAEVQIRSEGEEARIIRYRVGLDGTIYRGKNPPLREFATLLPKSGEKVGDASFFPCPQHGATITDCALLQPYPGDQAGLSEEQRQNWSGKFFRKGIGLEAIAGAGTQEELVEYRIGLNGKVVVKENQSKNHAAVDTLDPFVLVVSGTGLLPGLWVDSAPYAESETADPAVLSEETDAELIRVRQWLHKGQGYTWISTNKGAPSPDGPYWISQVGSSQPGAHFPDKYEVGQTLYPNPIDTELVEARSPLERTVFVKSGKVSKLILTSSRPVSRHDKQ